MLRFYTYFLIIQPLIIFSFSWLGNMAVSLAILLLLNTIHKLKTLCEMTLGFATTSNVWSSIGTVLKQHFPRRV